MPTRSRSARCLVLFGASLWLGLGGCAPGGGGDGPIRLDGGPPSGCDGAGDCPEGLVCVSGACGFAQEPTVPIDATGEWWMLRHHFVDPMGAPPPADVTGARFEQSGAEFTQYADGDPDFQVPGVIEGGTRYVQGGDGFTAVLGFTDPDTGSGTFTQGGFRFDMRFIRRAPPSHPGGGEWVREQDRAPVSLELASDELVIRIGGRTWRGRVAGARAVLVNETQGGADEALELAWQGPDQIVGVGYTREANGAPSQYGLRFLRPGALPDDETPPTVVDIFPAQRNGEVWPDTPISITFSEPVDPATLSADTVRLHPLQPVDGISYGPGEGLPVDFEVQGAVVRVRPARGRLQGFRTEYELSVTAGVRDLAGNPLTPPPLHRFRTLSLAEGATFQFVAPDGRLLAVAEPEGDAVNLPLVLAPEGPRTQWEIRWEGADSYLLHNPAAPAFGFVEGGDGAQPAVTTRLDLQTFSGQSFNLRAAQPRPDFAAGEGPATYYLTTTFQGPDRALDLRADGTGQLGMADINGDTLAWIVRRVGDRAPAECSSAADCGGYTCWPDARACFDWCTNGRACGTGYTCEPGGRCTSDAACAELGEGQCDGDVLRTCVAGEIIETDCQAQSDGRRRMGCRASAPGGVDRCVVLLGGACRDGFQFDDRTWPCEAGAVCTLGPDRWQCETNPATCDGEVQPYCADNVAIFLCTDYGQPLAFDCDRAVGAPCADGACIIPEGGGCFDPTLYRCEGDLICGEQRVCREPPVCQVDADCGDVRLQCNRGTCELRPCETGADCGPFDCVYGECQESCQATCEARWGPGTWVCDAPGGPCTRQDCLRSGDCPAGEDCVTRSHNRIGPRSTDLVCEGARQSPCDGRCQPGQICSGRGGDSPEERCR